jgi:hypothetical protein
MEKTAMTEARTIDVVEYRYAHNEFDLYSLRSGVALKDLMAVLQGRRETTNVLDCLRPLFIDPLEPQRRPYSPVDPQAECVVVRSNGAYQHVFFKGCSNPYPVLLLFYWQPPPPPIEWTDQEEEEVEEPVTWRGRGGSGGGGRRVRWEH